MPRTAMLALPSPPEASERMPGIWRMRSAEEGAPRLAMASAPMALTETELSMRFWPRATAVTMISSPSATPSSALSCAKAGLASRAEAAAPA